MIENTRNLLIRSKMLQIATFVFFVLTFWWLMIQPFSREVFVFQKNLWSAIYFVMSALGCIYGFIISKNFNGHKSLLGKIIIAFSVGLFLQSFGQITYSYNILFKKIETPYPSLGDIGYFGSIFSYIYGVFILARYIGITISVRSFLNKILTVIIPLCMLVFSYLVFLRGYEFKFSPLHIFLDFGYPLGEVIYLSIALLILFFSKKSLGGLLRKPILFLTFALIVQYISDSYFIYQANNDLWYLGGIVDYLYLLSYFLMTFVIIYIGDTFEKIRQENFRTDTIIAETKQDDLEQLFNQILTLIIKNQIRITGNLAWQEVKKIPEILILDEMTVRISIIGNPREVIDKLVYRYKDFFGDLAVQISKNAVYHLLMKLPSEDMPESLK